MTSVRAAYSFFVDWTNDGTLASGDTIDALWHYTIDSGPDGTIDGSPPTPSLEEVTADVRHMPVVKVTRGRDLAREYGPPVAGAATFTLDNSDGLYSSGNASSALYGYLNPGVLTRISATYAATPYVLHTGYLDVPAERPGPRQQLVDLTSFDALATLKASRISTAEYTNVSVDEAIGHVLDAAGFSPTLRSFATADTILARWCVADQDAFTAIRDLVYTEGPGALCFVDVDGVIVFQNRHFRQLTTRCTTSQATVRNDTTEPIYGIDFAHDPGVRGVVNSCTVPVNTYAVAASAVVWTGPTPVTLAGGEARSYTVSTTADWFRTALVPVAATDYTLTAGSVTPTLDRTSGKTATLTMTAGATGASFTGLQMRAEAVTVTTTSVSNSISGASATGVNYGLRTFPSQFIPPWLPDVNTAQDFCNYVVSRYKDPVPQVFFSLDNGASEGLTQALTRNVSDRVTVVENARAFVNGDFMVEQVTHVLSSGGNHTAVFGCERASDQAFWVLGLAGYGELGVATVLAY